MVYVTHDQEEAMTLGSRIAVMHDGAIEQVAAPMDLYERPANTFVARFIGSPAMNIWPCTLVRAGDGVTLRANGFRWDDWPVGHLDRDRVLVGVRPHDIDLAPAGAGDATGRVEILEPLGPTTLAHVGIEGSPDSRVRIIIAANTRVAVGDRVAFRVRRDRLHWFDGESGRRLDTE
jgi:ABC-type sugar transport system ATPase subunit